MVRLIRSFYVEITVILVLGAFMYLLTSGYSVLAAFTGWTRGWSANLAPELQNLSTIFLSIFIEGLPFILIGVFISSLIHIYVNEEMVWRWIPKNPFLSIPLATCMGILLPICECGIVPVARRLIQKGFPSYLAFTFLLAAPIINPVTIASTYLAFGDSWDMVTLRLVFGGGIAAAMGMLFYFFFSGKHVLKEKTQTQDGAQPLQASRHHHCSSGSHSPYRPGECTGHDHGGKKGLSHSFYHAIFEFIDMGKYFIAGALIAASFQTFVGLSAIKNFTESDSLTIFLMLGLAFGLSICSSADAFIAASFRSVIGTAPLLGFLVYGPMMDLKNVMMMLGSFRLSVVLFFFAGTTLFTFLSLILFL
ncbi:permease [Paenactinomyces guangxiensis]|uniref:Permease n=1 Tax=Paenactinomyces guangxiensis TaxID=1490290 RepID=A0A7W1WNW4_9BACL|nr:permease [Paenactinomyces guangxiensis]MBA4493341.1 permease [Paenactinomyces guangxiensis]MBH8593433.1 permease [Paenactinomyces guangxiensis]